jgi:hypothetical protein
MLGSAGFAAVAPDDLGSGSGPGMHPYVGAPAIGLIHAKKETT